MKSVADRFNADTIKALGKAQIAINMTMLFLLLVCQLARHKKLDSGEQFLRWITCRGAVDPGKFQASETVEPGNDLVALSSMVELKQLPHQKRRSEMEVPQIGSGARYGSKQLPPPPSPVLPPVPPDLSNR